MPIDTRPSRSLPPTRAPRPLRVGLAGSCEIVATGLDLMLRAGGHRMVLVASSHAVVDPSLDIVLVDGSSPEAAGRAAELQKRCVSVPVACYEPYAGRGSTQGGGGRRARVSMHLGADELVVVVDALRSAWHQTGKDRGHPGDDHDDLGDALRRLGCSPREVQVVTLICTGMSNVEIAEHLFVSVNTVKTYVRTAYRKLGIERRTQAVLWGVRHGA